MTIEVLIAKLMEYGTFPALLVLAALVAWLIRKLDKNAAADSARAVEFRDALEAHRKETDAKLAEQTERLACVERDYTKLDRHYQDIGGWRTELVETRSELRDGLQSLRAEISNLYGQIIKTVMEGSKNGAQG